MSDIAAAVRELHQRAPVLVRTGLWSTALFGVALLGLLLDPRTLNGAPVWLKPAKFGISTATYLFTLAWMTGELPRTRVLRGISATIGWLIVAEVVLVSLQAARGVPSHFNIDTPIDRTVFALMGIAIATVWVLSMVVLVQHIRTPARDRALAMAFRLGLALNIVGAAVGWVMVQPSPAQITAMQQGTHPFRAGAHTVGAADGGVGMPITNWSRTNGDLRVPHFVGLHAMQLLPLFTLLLRGIRSRRDDAIERSALTLVAGGSTALFVTALLQALAGRPFVWGV